jgi:hypothetical protein
MQPINAYFTFNCILFNFIVIFYAFNVFINTFIVNFNLGVQGFSPLLKRGH